MIRNLILFFGTFVVGAIVALVARAALFQPHAGHSGHPTGGGDYASMVTNPLTPPTSPAAAPASAPTPPPPKSPAADPHAGHGAAAPADSAKPVNTICAICGMDVNPSLPTATYQGQTIGFGCRMCPPRFKADPDRYGPSYLKNELYKS
jgi:hypothetical protein